MIEGCDDLLYVPMGRVRVIKDGLAGLRHYLLSGEWRFDPHQAVLLVLPTGLSFYVFNSTEFVETLLKHFQLNVSRRTDQDLKGAFNLSAETKAPLLTLGQTAEKPSVLIDGHHAVGVWIRATGLTRKTLWSQRLHLLALRLLRHVSSSRTILIGNDSR